MLDALEFAEIRREFAEKDSVREESIKTSRELIRQSKKVINAVHRGDTSDAGAEAGKLRTLKKKLEKINAKNSRGHHSVALQEYVEALAYLSFARKRRIPSRKTLGVDSEHYLSGLCDMTGELIRKSLNEILDDDYVFAADSKKLIEDLHQQLSEMHLAGELRKKADMVRWNLNKIGDILFTAKMKGGL